MAGYFVYSDVYSVLASPSPDIYLPQSKTFGLQNYSDSKQRNAIIHRAAMNTFGTNFKFNSSYDPDVFANVTALDLSGRPGSRVNLIDEKLPQNSELHWLKSDLGFPDETALLDSSAFTRTNNRALDKPAQTAKFLRWLNSGSSLNFPRDITASGAFLKRFRRQIQQAQAKELPNWPGMPQGVLRATEDVDTLRKKVFDLMLQSMYSAQERLWPLENIIKKYNHLTPYRMAFIFMKLDQLVQESHTLYMYLKRMGPYEEMTMLRRVQLHSQLARRNIDVTYLVDYISERVPRDQMTRFRQWIIRQEQEKLLSNKILWDKTTRGYTERPPPARNLWVR